MQKVGVKMRIIRVSAVWCPSCLIMNKVWKKIEIDYPDLKIEKYDYDLDEEIIEKYQIGKVLPVVIFLSQNNQELERMVGEVRYEELVAAINRYQNE